MAPQKTLLSITVLLSLTLALPAIVAAHGSKHPHSHADHKNDHSTSLDSLNFVTLDRLQKLHARIIDDFEHYRLGYDYQQTADKLRLYHDENGIDRRALVDDLLKQEGMTQHYSNNILQQTLAEGERIVSKPGYFGRKSAHVFLKYLTADPSTRADAHHAGRLLFKPDNKLLRNIRFNLLSRLTSPEIETTSQAVAFDIHVHSVASFDGISEMETLILAAANRGLGAIAITDHDNFNEVYIARKAAARLKREGAIPQDFLIVAGQEVSSRDGHILALFIRAPIPSLLSAEATIEAIHQQGGLAIAPHPFESHFGLGEKQIERLPLDGMVLTGATPSEFAQSADLAEKVQHRMAIFMDTDAHAENAVGWSGYTLIYTNERTEAGLQSAIRRRATEPVYRKLVHGIKQLSQHPMYRLWLLPLTAYHEKKHKLEALLSDIFFADNADIETIVDVPLEQVSNFYGLSPLLFDDGWQQLLRKSVVRKINLDYAHVRVSFQPGQDATVQLQLKYAWLPGG